MPARTNETAHVTTDKLFEDLGFSPEEAAVLELKLKLHNEIMKVVTKQSLTPRQLERLLDVPQPKVSDLMTGKISKMSVDKLTKYLYRLGREVRITTKKARKLEAV